MEGVLINSYSVGTKNGYRGDGLGAFFFLLSDRQILLLRNDLNFELGRLFEFVNLYTYALTGNTCPSRSHVTLSIGYPATGHFIIKEVPATPITFDISLMKGNP